MALYRQLLFLEGDAVIESLRAVETLRDEVEAYAADVLLGTEVLKVVDLVALYLQLHEAPATKTDTVASAQMVADDLRQSGDDSDDGGRVVGAVLACLLDNIKGTDGVEVSSHSLVFTEGGKLGLGLSFDSVFHVLLLFFGKVTKKGGKHQRYPSLFCNLGIICYI